MKHIRTAIGRRIAEQRTLAGFTQARLAEKLNVAAETISRLETGARMPSLARLVAIALALGIELHDLLHLKPGNDAHSRAMEKMAWQMSRRTASDIELVMDIAAKIFSHAEGD